MKSKIIRNGKLEVFENGQVFRFRRGVKVEAAQCPTCRDRKYFTVTYMEDGKQKHEYVHRLVAEAFIPNPNNYPQINHKDGNPSNNCADNLEWCTQRQNTKHAYVTGLIDPMRNAKPCTRCGKLTNSKSGVCPMCQPKVKQEENAEIKTEEIIEKLSEINLDILSRRNRGIVQMRMQGKSMEEVGEAFGISRQRVEQIISLSLFKSKLPPKVNLSVKREKDRLKKKLSKKQWQLGLIKEQAESLQAEIDEINQILSEIA